ncbi:MAG: hypothetical protein N2234_05515 [Planctomycetota bacterium]|nr:hypothetical protein [Planctomycetota bacterium]
MVKERKGKIGFMPADKLVCEMVEDALETRLKRIRTLVKDEVNLSLKNVENKVKEIEERMMVTFGKIQGEIEMMSHMEMKEEQTLLARIERLEANLVAIVKEIEALKMATEKISQQLQVQGREKRGNIALPPKREETDY